MKIIITYAFLSFLFNVAQANSIYTEAVSSDHDRYCAALLLKILNYGDTQYTLEHSQVQSSQTRDILNLKQKKFDVIWVATSESIEENIQAIRIPIYKGLLGYRIFLILNGNQNRFDNLYSTEDLRSISIGQGLDWSDTEILKANKFKVEGSLKHHYLFSMLVRNRFDAFARGVHEPWAEMKKYSDLNLAVERHHVLIYPMPMYFFVHNDNAILAETIESNFNAMIDDGVFDNFFYNYPMIKNSLINSKLSERRQHYLKNPFLPKETPLAIEKYWIDFNHPLFPKIVESGDSIE